MTLDPALLRDAVVARERLAVAQHEAERARVGYHHAIRRLHAAGGSLREIAEVLHLSHQRVHQIIDEAAEPTRRRRWRREPQVLPEPPGPCSFCGRPHDVCAKLIAGPGVYICDRCVVHAFRLDATGSVDDRAEAPMLLEPSGSQARCSFCGKQARKVRRVVTSGLAGARDGKYGQQPRICDRCLLLCEEILAESAARDP